MNDNSSSSPVLNNRHCYWSAMKIPLLYLLVWTIFISSLSIVIGKYSFYSFFTFFYLSAAWLGYRLIIKTNQVLIDLIIPGIVFSLLSSLIYSSVHFFVDFFVILISGVFFDFFLFPSLGLFFIGGILAIMKKIINSRVVTGEILYNFIIKKNQLDFINGLVTFPGIAIILMTIANYIHVAVLFIAFCSSVFFFIYYLVKTFNKKRLMFYGLLLSPLFYGIVFLVIMINFF